ncbi:hypothetical protein VTJ04DRAFT_3638 [Mycothermus thermophilus]|uniref:uncharacterized protein n=1 Tax=Humicola insolens TaxID=85995 RepID=UPI003742CD94
MTGEAQDNLASSGASAPEHAASYADALRGKQASSTTAESAAKSTLDQEAPDQAQASEEGKWEKVQSTFSKKKSNKFSKKKKKKGPKSKGNETPGPGTSKPIHRAQSSASLASESSRSSKRSQPQDTSMKPPNVSRKAVADLPKLPSTTSRNRSTDLEPPSMSRNALISPRTSAVSYAAALKGKQSGPSSASKKLAPHGTGTEEFPHLPQPGDTATGESQQQNAQAQEILEATKEANESELDHDITRTPHHPGATPVGPLLGDGFVPTTLTSHHRATQVSSGLDHSLTPTGPTAHCPEATHVGPHLSDDFARTTPTVHHHEAPQANPRLDYNVAPTASQHAATQIGSHLDDKQHKKAPSKFVPNPLAPPFPDPRTYTSSDGATSFQAPTFRNHSRVNRMSSPSFNASSPTSSMASGDTRQFPRSPSSTRTDSRARTVTGSVPVHAANPGVGPSGGVGFMASSGPAGITSVPGPSNAPYAMMDVTQGPSPMPAAAGTVESYLIWHGTGKQMLSDTEGLVGTIEGRELEALRAQAIQAHDQGRVHLLNNPHFWDVKLRCGYLEWKLHRNILCRESPVFEKLLPPRRSDGGYVELDCTVMCPIQLSHAVLYMYDKTKYTQWVQPTFKVDAEPIKRGVFAYISGCSVKCEGLINLALSAIADTTWHLRKWFEDLPRPQLATSNITKIYRPLEDALTMAFEQGENPLMFRMRALIAHTVDALLMYMVINTDFFNSALVPRWNAWLLPQATHDNVHYASFGMLNHLFDISRQTSGIARIRLLIDVLKKYDEEAGYSGSGGDEGDEELDEVEEEEEEAEEEAAEGEEIYGAQEGQAGPVTEGHRGGDELEEDAEKEEKAADESSSSPVFDGAAGALRETIAETEAGHDDDPVTSPFVKGKGKAPGPGPAPAALMESREGGEEEVVSGVPTPGEPPSLAGLSAESADALEGEEGEEGVAAAEDSSSAPTKGFLQRIVEAAQRAVIGGAAKE